MAVTRLSQLSGRISWPKQPVTFVSLTRKNTMTKKRQKQIAKFKKFYQQFVAEWGRRPSVRTICRRMKVTQREFSKVYREVTGRSY